MLQKKVCSSDESATLNHQLYGSVGCGRVHVAETDADSVQDRHMHFVTLNALETSFSQPDEICR
jgi:hypothetical protein